MVAKIIIGKNLSGVLRYNENKVKEGEAQCIFGNRFIDDPIQMPVQSKARWFKLWTSENERVKTNAVHISLNFHKTDELDKDKLIAIANAYMTKVGFGDQPFLVYQHFDAAHPHLHIATTNVMENGKRIDLHNIGRNQSEQARTQVEDDFSLIKAKGQASLRQTCIEPVTLENAIYGKSETKQAISNIVREISREYLYTSFPEFNAALSLFNVTADRGHEGTKMFQNKGLVYSIVDLNGEKIGVPIKASSISGKPTLPFIESRFKPNTAARKKYLSNIAAVIDNAFAQGDIRTKEDFQKQLDNEAIIALFRTNSEGRTYGVTYVDRNSKVVVKGSDVGRQYGAVAVLAKISQGNRSTELAERIQSSQHDPLTFHRESNPPTIAKVLSELIKPEQDHTIPLNFKKKKRKRKTKRIS